MESEIERELRLLCAQNEYLADRFGPTGLIAPVVAPDGNAGESEPEKIENPIDSACYDALVYLRENMSREEVLNMILLRNRIAKSDAERIIDEVIKNERNKNV